ncbi:hypothetical protein LVJ94_32205 [Pendulispora rubella]|uniref:Uncharacterized protein n=1 Tax=Pendulispora rubella TaxID=2741070 RepID=A0ABZ2KX35_9BACT
MANTPEIATWRAAGHAASIQCAGAIAKRITANAASRSGKSRRSSIPAAKTAATYQAIE